MTAPRPERLEVLFFLPQLGGGGAEMNAVRLAPGLLAAGVKPIYAVGRGPGSYARLLPDDAEVVVLDTGSIDSSLVRLLGSRRPLARLIDERRPSVLCPVLAMHSVAALSALGFARHRPTVVASIQNSLSVSHEQGSSPRARIELALIRRYLPRTDGVIALSHGVADELRRIVPAISSRVDAAPNVGLPTPDQMAAALSQPRPEVSTESTIVACGRLTRQKDYPTLLKAFAMLSGDDVRLMILGEGPLRHSLQQLTTSLGISERVEFLGFQKDPFSYMRQADIFVLSSLWEGFGNVIVEAMAMGAPVVATDCPHGPAEIIDDGETGLLVPPRDAAALSAAIQRLLDDAALRQKLSEAGQKRAQAFSTEKIGAEYARLFRHFVSQANSA